MPRLLPIRLLPTRLLLVLLLLCSGAGPLAAADPVPVGVRGGLHEGYGRIVFDWPREVGYQARIEGDTLQLDFDVPAAFDGTLLRDGLAGYTAAAQVAPDGRGVTLPLSGAATLKHFRLGPKVVVDLQRSAPAAAAAAPEPTPEPTPDPAADPAAERVTVRGGRHADFSRLVFDWAAPVGEMLEEAPGRARLVFDRPAAFDLSGVQVERLPQLAAISAAPDSVTIDFPAGSRLRLDHAGPKVVLDILAPQAAAAPEATSKAAPEAAPETAPGAAPKAAPEATGQAPKAAAVEDLSPRPAPAEAAPAEKAEAAPAAAPTPLIPTVMGGAAAAPEKAPEPKAATGAEKPAAPAPAAATAAAVSDGERGELSIATEPMPDFLTSQAQGPRADGFEPVKLTFTWQQPTAAAAFRRGEHLWLAFDRPAPRDLVNRIAAAAPHLGDVRLLEDGGSTILLIRTQPTVAPRLSRDGTSWSVDLRPRSPLPERALAAPVVETPENRADGYARVRYPVVGTGRMLWVTDPDAGDRLVVVPLRGAGMGLTLPYGFPQFRSLPTHQGIVLQPLTAGIEVATVRNGVLVRDRDGLLVSKPRERRSTQRAADPLTDSPGLFDLAAWRRGGIESYQDNRKALLAAMADLEKTRLGLARLDLARFYFAHGLDSETLGSVTVIEDEHPRLAQDPEVVLMKAAGQVMIEDYRGAAVTLAHPALAGEREALLWQAALAAQAEDWAAAATGFAATLDLIEPYPRNVRLPLGLAAAEAFIRAGDLEAATLQVAALLRESLDDREMAQVNVVHGMLQLAKGEPEEARRLWSEARDGAHRPSQARARLALIELGMDEGTLSPEAAIEELERLRFAWRGDLFEFTLLRKLADLYVGLNRHRDALYALREAVMSFPDGPAARDSAQRMREIFAEIYRGPGDPDVPPLRALALYQEFMELTPGGPEGDRLIAGLADRLVEVDLLDRAAELLEGQVRYRLEGAEKARIGARLALVHLLDRAPAAGLEALDISEVADLEGPVVAQRRQLRARALSDLGRAGEALAALEGDDSLEAEQLRADIHWNQREWPQAVDSLSKLIPLLPPRRQMAEDESQLVVNLAVALMLAGETVELEDLNRRYGAAMAKGPHADTFNLLVGDGDKTAVASIADELSKVAAAQDFMTNYRERLTEGNLSQFN